jgi:hypothetical protein
MLRVLKKENGVAKKQQEPTENVGKNKSITTKPQSVKSKPTIFILISSQALSKIFRKFQI